MTNTQNTTTQNAVLATFPVWDSLTDTTSLVQAVMYDREFFAQITDADGDVEIIEQADSAEHAMALALDLAGWNAADIAANRVG